jgi:hypothetical protein
MGLVRELGISAPGAHRRRGAYDGEWRREDLRSPARTGVRAAIGDAQRVFPLMLLRARSAKRITRVA